MRLVFNLAYINILERPLKLVNIIDDQFIDELIKKFREFSLFKYMKEIVENISMSLKTYFTEFGLDLFVSKEFSFIAENVH